jgi:sn-glycerol 3-phosphate transport system permease protein
VITIIFFYWPAGQTLWQSFLLQDAFGLSTKFIAFENYKDLFAQPEYYRTVWTTFVFLQRGRAAVALVCAAAGDPADKQIAGAGAYRTLLIWPYAVAPAVAGVLWIFMFHPSLGVLGRGLRDVFGVDWNPLLNDRHCHDHGGARLPTWKQISYNFLFFPCRAAGDPAQRDRSGGDRRRATAAPVLDHHVSAAARRPTFFLLVVNIVYAFFDTFGIIDAMTGGGPSKATETLVYKIYSDGRLGGDLGGSAGAVGHPDGAS